MVPSRRGLVTKVRTPFWRLDLKVTARWLPSDSLHQRLMSGINLGAGTTTGMLGYMFWAAGCQGNGTGCTFPPNSCQIGMGGAATAFNIPIPMPALRQN